MTQIVLQKDSESKLSAVDLHLLCGVCDEKSAALRWDENYGGYRGRCSICENDWPES